MWTSISHGASRPQDGRSEDRARQGRWRRREGRTFSYGIRLHVIVRETSAEAWRAADELIAKAGRRRRSRPRKRPSLASIRSVSSAWRACTAGGATSSKSRQILWAGVGLVRGGAGTALVGNPDEVAERMKEYMDARHRPLHPVRLSASRGMLSLRRTRVPEAAAQDNDRHRSRASEERGTVRRSHRQRRRALGTESGGRLREARALMRRLESTTDG